MNAVTPKSSPLPTPKHKKELFDVLIPPNICDPLNLTCNDNEEYEKLFFPLKRTSKRRNRKKKRPSSSLMKDEVTDETVKVKKLNDGQHSEVTERENSAEKSPSDRIQPKDLEEEQEKSHLRESKSESTQKDKSKGNVGKIGKIGNKFEREDKIKLRLKGLEEPKDKRLRKVGNEF